MGDNDFDKELEHITFESERSNKKFLDKVEDFLANPPKKKHVQKPKRKADKNLNIAMGLSAIVTALFYYYFLRPVVQIFGLSEAWSIGLAVVFFFIGAGWLSLIGDFSDAIKKIKNN